MPCSFGGAAPIAPQLAPQEEPPAQTPKRPKSLCDSCPDTPGGILTTLCSCLYYEFNAKARQHPRRHDPTTNTWMPIGHHPVLHHPHSTPVRVRSGEQRIADSANTQLQPDQPNMRAYVARSFLRSASTTAFTRATSAAAGKQDVQRGRGGGCECGFGGGRGYARSIIGGQGRNEAGRLPQRTLRVSAYMANSCASANSHPIPMPTAPLLTSRPARFRAVWAGICNPFPPHHTMYHSSHMRLQFLLAVRLFPYGIGSKLTPTTHTHTHPRCPCPPAPARRRA